ncbi:MAG: hypothetical protein AAF581_17475 [Planctomycetota bacterium]
MAGKFLTATLAVSLLSGCSVADLRPTPLRAPDYAQSAAGVESLQRGGARWDAARAALGSHRWDQSRSATFRLRDVWNSTFYRWFTPLSANSVQLQMTIDCDQPRSRVEIAGEAGTTLVRRDQTAYTIDGNDEAPAGGLAFLYLESLQVYLELLFTSFSDCVSLPVASVGDTEYDRVFATNNGLAVSADQDQYVFWISRRDSRVAFVEFTYRGVTQSYRGVLRYRDFRVTGGIQFPHTIEIADDLTESPAVHTLLIEEVALQ